MSMKNYKAWALSILSLLLIFLLIVPPSPCKAAEKKGKTVKKVSIPSKKEPIQKEGPAAEQINPALPTGTQGGGGAVPPKLDETWLKDNQALLELIKEKKNDEALAKAADTINYLKGKKMLESAEAATTHNNLGMIYLTKGNFAEANSHLVQALALRTKLYGGESIEVATVWLNLSELYKQQAQYIFLLHQKPAETTVKADDDHKR